MWKLNYKGRNRGFTLIELLVTIGIIGVLAGIGVVTVGKIKGTKNQATCISNLRVISQGLQSYYNDLRVFPDDGYPYDANDTLPLSTELAGYITTKSTFICPTDNDPTSISDFASYDPYYVARKGSYGENELAIGCPRHRGAKSSTSAFSTGATEITKIGAVQVNGQEIPPDGTTAQRTISSNGDTMTFDDLSTVTITDASGGSYGCFLVQSVRLSDGTLYSIVRVQNNGTIDVEVTSGSKFEIVTPSAIVGVRGTQFTVTTTNLGFTTEVSLSEGTVVLQNRDTGGTTTLTGVDTGTVNVPTHTHFHYHVDGTYHDHSHQALNNAHHGNPAVARKLAAASTDANVDDDGDGYTENQGDCDDTDSAVNPGTAEVLNNGKDDDCNQSTSDIDVDLDGYGTDTDCNDNDPNVNPGMAEIVDNGKDDDCNSATPDSSLDIDDDGDGYTENQGDCDDISPDVNPGMTEILDNAIDDDCNPATPDSSLDIDDDGDGYTENEGDCNDAEDSVNPGETEISYNGKDDDCNPGTLDDDLDSDTYLAVTDCDDNDPDVNPGALEILDNGKDDDCDPNTVDSSIDQVLLDMIADPLVLSATLRDALIAASPLSDVVINAMINRTNPPQLQSDNMLVLQSNYPLSENILLTVINHGTTLTSSDYGTITFDHYPLTDTVLYAMIDKDIMSSGDYDDVLVQNSPLTDYILNKMINQNALSSSINNGAYRNILEQNSPLTDGVLTTMINEGTIMSSNNYEYILELNSPLTDGVLTTLINQGEILSSNEYDTILLFNSPLTDSVLITMINKGTIMNSGSYSSVLTSHNPLSEPVLDAMVTIGTIMTSSTYRDILISNSPLPLSILTKVNLGIPPLDPLDLIAVLAAQL